MRSAVAPVRFASSTTPTSSRIFYGWRIVVALGVTTIVSYGNSQYLFGLLVDPVARELRMDRASIGLAYAGVVLVGGLAGLVLGPALDRFGARLLLSAGSIVSGVSLLAIARAHDGLTFSLLWTLGMGAGTALTYYPVTMTVVANWFDRGRTRALGVLTFMGAFSSTITYPIAGALIARLGWREAVAILAVAQIAITLPLHALIVRRHPEDLGLFPDGAPYAGSSTPSSGVTFRAALRSVAFWLPTIAIALAYFASTAVLLEHVAYLIHAGYAPAFAATLVGLFGLAYLPGRWFVTWGAERIGLATLFAVTFAVEAVGVAVLATAPVLPGVIAYVCTFGAGYGATSPLRGALMAQRFGRRAYGAILAAQGVPVGIVAALGPVVTGRLIDALGYRAAFTGCVAALVLAAVLIVVPARPPRGLAASSA